MDGVARGGLRVWLPGAPLALQGALPVPLQSLFPKGHSIPSSSKKLCLLPPDLPLSSPLIPFLPVSCPSWKVCPDVHADSKLSACSSLTPT